MWKIEIGFGIGIERNFRKSIPIPIAIPMRKNPLRLLFHITNPYLALRRPNHAIRKVFK
jgi:hypothetical protein